LVVGRRIAIVVKIILGGAGFVGPGWDVCFIGNFCPINFKELCFVVYGEQRFFAFVNGCNWFVCYEPSLSAKRLCQLAIINSCVLRFTKPPIARSPLQMANSGEANISNNGRIIMLSTNIYLQATI